MFSSNTTQVSSGGYQISRSLRFNSADSAYLNRTPASAGNRTTWTYSGWVKRSGLANYNMLMSASSTDWIGFTTDDTFWVRLNDGSGLYQSSAVYRDVSAWYHVVVAVDTTQATASNRMKLYINGVQITSFGTNTQIPQNTNTTFNSTVGHGLGYLYGVGYYANFYSTEVVFIDGQQLTPSSFGETNAQTGVWQPKAYSGSYGTNGFYLNFSDNSNTTAATLGKDYSGNGNNWTPNNFSVTAGAGNDSLVDVPTPYGVDTGIGGTVRGNYLTLNPLDKGSNITLANGNLDWSGTLAGLVRGTIAAKSDKYYFECVASTSYFLGFALTSASASLSANPAAGAPSGYWGWAIDDNSNNFYFYSDGTNPFTASRTTSAGDVYQLAVDATSSSSVKLWVGVNNTWYNSSGGTTGDPATGANPTVTITSGVDLFPSGCNTNSTNAVSMNFGQRPFAYTAPSGFKALCTQNLPTPTIGATTATQASQFFTPVLYTGDGTTGRSIAVGFQPDFTWIKTRDPADWHVLDDSVRGAGKILASNSTQAEATDTTAFNAFNSNGFVVGTSAGWHTNRTGGTYVAWNWKANGSGSTNTAGSITSTVSANTTSGFSVVTWTGNATDNASVGHGLGVAPKMVIIKNRSTSAGWPVYTNVIDGSMDALYLNLTDAKVDTGRNQFTSSVFYVSSGTDTNGSGNSLVAYCFSEVAGYSKFGSYTGNGSADGPFVFTGFRPAYVMIKGTSSGANATSWAVFDSKRNTYNLVDNYLLANDSGAESQNSTVLSVDFLSNGFKVRSSSSLYGINQTSNVYIYACFAENPFKYSLAR